MILDGWGLGDASKSDVISKTQTGNIDRISEKYPSSKLKAAGEAVGLPEGQMGNSEVGHLNLGAGRVVYQDLVKINRAIKEGDFFENEKLDEAFMYAREKGKQVHLVGLLSDGGVHSHIDHLLALCDMTQDYGLGRVFVHAFGDGRDTDPRSGKGYLKKLLAHIDNTSIKLASFIGRYYAMDRDKRWKRIKLAYELLAKGEGKNARNMVDALQESYDQDVTDEFVKPIVHVDESGKPVAHIKEGDVVIFFNFRNDRARQLTEVLTQKDMPEYDMKTIPLHYCTMTRYDAEFKGLHVLFPKEDIINTIGEVLAKNGKKQLRIAETEKYAHVTFFFSGGREEKFDHESRILIPSPDVDTYDLKPEMSAYKVKDALIDEINQEKHDFICLNFANGDMVGHTGIYEAIQKAVTAVDECAGEVVQAAVDHDFEVLIIADHGNADNAVNSDGSPNTAHSLNPVPCVLVTQRYDSIGEGILADISPTILKLMDIAIPEEMTGKPLV